MSSRKDWTKVAIAGGAASLGLFAGPTLPEAWQLVQVDPNAESLLALGKTVGGVVSAIYALHKFRNIQRSDRNTNVDERPGQDMD